MENDSWTGRFSSTSSRRYQSAIQSRSDPYLGFEEFDGDEEPRVELPCPFCAEDFDIVGLCIHIEEDHPVDAKNGVCPVCGMRVGVDIVGHIVTQHGQYYKMQRKRRSRKGSQSSLSFLRKELRDGNLQALLGGSASVISSSNAAPDPLLSSFMYNLPMFEEPATSQSRTSAELSSEYKIPEECVLESGSGISVERTPQPSPLSDKDQEERVSRCEFVQGMLLSTMFDDIL